MTVQGNFGNRYRIGKLNLNRFKLYPATTCSLWGADEDNPWHTISECFKIFPSPSEEEGLLWWLEQRGCRSGTHYQEFACHVRLAARNKTLIEKQIVLLVRHDVKKYMQLRNGNIKWIKLTVDRMTYSWTADNSCECCNTGGKENLGQLLLLECPAYNGLRVLSPKISNSPSME